MIHSSLRARTEDAIRPALIEPQGTELALNSPHLCASVAIAQRPQGAAGFAIGAAFDHHHRAVGDKGVEFLCVRNPHADAPVGCVAADGFGLVGAVDAVVAPGNVQPEKAGAESAHLPGEPVRDAEHADGRGRVPCAGGYGVLPQELIALPERQRFHLHIHMDAERFVRPGCRGDDHQQCQREKDASQGIASFRVPVPKDMGRVRQI